MRKIFIKIFFVFLLFFYLMPIRATEQVPDSVLSKVYSLYKQGRELKEDNNPVAAHECFSKAFSLIEKDHEYLNLEFKTYIFLALFPIDDEETEWEPIILAINDFADGTKSDHGADSPEYAFLLYIHGQIYELADNTEDAIASYELSKRIYSDHEGLELMEVVVNKQLQDIYIGVRDIDNIVRTSAEAVRLFGIYFEEEGTTYASALQAYASWLTELQGTDDKVKELYTRSYDVLLRGLDDANSYSLSLLIDYADFLESRQELYEKINVLECVVEIAPSCIDTISIAFVNYLSPLAHSYSRVGLQNNATRIMERAVAIADRLDLKDEWYLIRLMDMATHYGLNEEWPNAETVAVKALAIAEELAGEVPEQYAMCLCNYATMKARNDGNHILAKEMLHRAVKILEEGELTWHPYYHHITHELAQKYKTTGDEENYVAKVMDLIGKMEGGVIPDHPHRGGYYKKLGEYYDKKGDFKLASECYEKSLSIFREKLDRHDVDLHEQIINHSWVCYRMGLYEQGVEALEEVAAYRKQVSANEDDKLLARGLGLLTMCYARMGRYVDAVETGREACRIAEIAYGLKSESYVLALNNLAVAYGDMGDRERVASYLEETISIARMIEAKPSIICPSLTNLAANYSEKGRMDEAINLIEEMLAIYETVPEEKYSDGNGLVWASRIFKVAGDLDRAMEYAEKARDIRRDINGENSLLQALSLHDLYNISRSMEDKDQALQFAQKAYDITSGLDASPFHRLSLEYIAISSAHATDRTATERYAGELLSNVIRGVSSNFTTMTADERGHYWSNVKNSLLQIPRFSHIFPESSELAAHAYDAMLFSKGLLLNSEVEFAKVLSDSGDPILIAKFDELKKLRIFIDNVIKMPVDARSVNLQELIMEAEALERELAEGSRRYGEYTRNMTVKWQDVATFLGQGDIAIEFAEVHRVDGSLNYMAFVLKSGWETPRAINLFTKKEFDNTWLGHINLADAMAFDAKADEKLIYDSPESGRIVWTELQTLLDGVKNVYFSPDGLLHHLAVEYLIVQDGERMCDKYNMHRLSSTRQLIGKDENVGSGSIALFGGLEYDTRTDQSQNNIVSSDHFAAEKSRTLLQRSGIQATYLPATLDEVKKIQALVKDESTEIRLFTAAEGTEESFKSLSGSGMQILHMATHGFFLPQDDDYNGDFAWIDLNEGMRQEDISLAHSGLLLSGVNSVLSGREPRKDTEDGILTAKEISRLDLRGMDLVVLSACQTALGEITGEGVFGLQRGFKKAGAGSLLMSLWKVDDRATEVFMTTFYDNLIAGQSKRQAFDNARRYLMQYRTAEKRNVVQREKDPRTRISRPVNVEKEVEISYADPYYWAAFILLD